MNYQQVRNDLAAKLKILQQRAEKPFMQKPVIYHLDVSAMYPNIILTNRLQPHAVVNDDFCNNCDYNFKESNCKRWMTWMWRGIYYPCTYQEYNMVVGQLQGEKMWANLTDDEREKRVKHSLELFC